MTEEETPEEFLRSKIAIIHDQNVDYVRLVNALKAVEIAKKQEQKIVSAAWRKKIREKVDELLPKTKDALKEAEARGIEIGKKQEKRYWQTENLALATANQLWKDECNKAIKEAEARGYEKGKKETAKAHIADIEKKRGYYENEKFFIFKKDWEEIKKRWCKDE